LAAANLAASFVVAVASIALAAMKYSYMAPIWGTLAGNVVLSGILACRQGSLGVLRLSFSGYQEVVHFGLYSSGVSVINVFYNLCPQLFLARNLDFASVGLYSRAVGVTQLFDRLVMQAISPVIMPGILSHQKAGADVKRLYLDAIELISVLQWPFLLFIASMARPIIESWLGNSWIAVTPLIRILCFANLALFAAGLTYPTLVAVGKVRVALISSMVSLPPSLLAIYVTSFWGVHAVTLSALLTLPLQTVAAIYFVGRELNIKWTDIGRSLVKSGIVAGIVALVSVACNGMFEVGEMSSVASVVLGCCAAGVSWWLGLTATKHPLLSHLHSVFEGTRGRVAISSNLWPRKSGPPLKVRS
jgi:O-antigen/teichoic acid export membrane protein